MYLVPNISSDERVRLESHQAALANNAEEKVIHLFPDLVPSMKDWVEIRTARARASVHERRLTVPETLCRVEKHFDFIVSSEYVSSDGLLDVDYVIPAHDVLCLPSVDAARHGSSSAVPESDEIQAASSSRSQKCFKALKKDWTKRRKTSTMRIWSNDAKRTSADMPLIELKNNSA